MVKTVISKDVATWIKSALFNNTSNVVLYENIRKKPTGMQEYIYDVVHVHIDTIAAQINDISFFETKEDAETFISKVDEYLDKITNNSIRVKDYTVTEYKGDSFIPDKPSTLFRLGNVIFSINYNVEL